MRLRTTLPQNRSARPRGLSKPLPFHHPIAIITNALRVSGTGVLVRYYGTQVADGFFHTFSGWVIYIAASLLLFATGWLLDRFRRRPSRLQQVV